MWCSWWCDCRRPCFSLLVILVVFWRFHIDFGVCCRHVVSMQYVRCRAVVQSDPLCCVHAPWGVEHQASPSQGTLGVPPPGRYGFFTSITWYSYSHVLRIVAFASQVHCAIGSVILRTRPLGGGAPGGPVSGNTGRSATKATWIMLLRICHLTSFVYPSSDALRCFALWFRPWAAEHQAVPSRRPLGVPSPRRSA